MVKATFGSLFVSIKNGLSVKQDKSGFGLPITRIETIANSRIDGSRVGYAGLDLANSKNWLLEPGDLLFSHINSVEHVGKVAVYRGDPPVLVHGMNLLALRPDRAKLDPEFAKHLIRSAGFRSDLSRFINKAVNQASVSIGNLNTIWVEVPPIEEQRRIADILDRADALRAKRREAVALLADLNQSIFVDVTRRSPTQARPLEELCSFFSGFAWKSSEFSTENGMPVIRIQNVDSSQDTALVRWPGTYDPRFVISAGDILLTLSGSFRVSRWTGPPALLNQRIVRLTPLPNVNRTWFLQAVRGLVGEIESLGRHALVSNVALTDLRKLPVTVPSIDAMNEYERRGVSVDLLRSRMVASLHDLHELSAALWERAFAGELG